MSMNYFDILEACAQAGCPLCRLSLEVVRRHVEDVLYEHTNDIEVRAQIRQAHGYCNRHSWLMCDGRGNSLSVAIIQRDVIETAIETIEAAASSGNRRQAVQQLRKRLRSTGPCAVCEYEHSIEDVMLQTLLTHLADAELAEALVGSSGLCLVHFARALELVDDVDTLALLVGIQQRTLAAVRDDLVEFIRKNDHRFITEGFGKEGDSWTRAVGTVAGQRGVR